MSVGRSRRSRAARPRSCHQVGETDWTFLSRLVASHGGELDVAGGKLHIIDPAKTKRRGGRARLGRDARALPPARLEHRPGGEGHRPRLGPEEEGGDRQDRPCRRRRPRSRTPPSTARSAAARSTSSPRTVSTDGDADAAAAAIAGAPRPRARPGRGVRDRRPAPAGRRLREVLRRRHALRRRAPDRLGRPHVYGARGYQTRLTLGAGGRPLAQALNGAQRAPRTSPTISSSASSRQRRPGQARAREGQVPDARRRASRAAGRASCAARRATAARRGRAAARQRRGHRRLRERRRAPAVRARRALQRRGQAGRRPRQDDELVRGALPARPRRRDEGRRSSSRPTRA